MPPPGKTLVVIATYNERENLPQLVSEVFHAAEDAAILVVDDNSPDGTGRWCDQAAAKDARLHCIHRAGKQGLGTAILAGLRYAIENDFDWAVTMDADFSHHPRYLPALLAKAADGKVDVVIGSRYVAGGGVVGWPLRRRLMSRGVNLLARGLLGLPIRDCSGNYRCYCIAALERLDLDAMTARGYSLLEEILWRLKRSGASMAEVPILFTDRAWGQSKIDTSEAAAAVWTILRLGARNWLRLR